MISSDRPVFVWGGGADPADFFFFFLPSPPLTPCARAEGVGTALVAIELRASTHA